MFMIEIYFYYHLVSIAAAKKPLLQSDTKKLKQWIIFINSSENWKVSSLLLELEDFIFALSMEILEGFILALLLNGHVQVIKKLKDLILDF